MPSAVLTHNIVYLNRVGETGFVINTKVMGIVRILLGLYSFPSGIPISILVSVNKILEIRSLIRTKVVCINLIYTLYYRLVANSIVGF